MHGSAQPDGPPLGGSELQSYFSQFVDQNTLIKFACVGVSVVCNAIIRLTMFCCSGDICDQVAKLRKIVPKFWCFSAAKFPEGGTQIANRISQIRVTIEHVAKSDDDRPSDLGD